MPARIFLTKDEAKKLGYGVEKIVTSNGKPKRSKYGNRRTTVPPQHVPGFVFPEMQFDSKREANYYLLLCEKWRNDEIKYFVMQVPLVLPGKVRMRIDFMVVPYDRAPQWIDAKGKPTRDWLNKRKQAEDAYGITIETV